MLKHLKNLMNDDLTKIIDDFTEKTNDIIKESYDGITKVFSENNSLTEINEEVIGKMHTSYKNILGYTSELIKKIYANIDKDTPKIILQDNFDKRMLKSIYTIFALVSNLVSNYEILSFSLPWSDKKSLQDSMGSLKKELNALKNDLKVFQD